MKYLISISFVYLLLSSCMPKAKTSEVKPEKTQDKPLSLIEITDENFDSIVLKSDKIVLVDFCANWNQPCVMLDPIMKDLAAEYAGKVIIGKIAMAPGAKNNKNKKTFQKYQISTIPMVMIFKNGKLVDKLAGRYPKSDYKARIDKVLGL